MNNDHRTVSDPTRCPALCKPDTAVRHFLLADGTPLRWCRLCGTLWRPGVIGGRQGVILQTPGVPLSMFFELREEAE
jgi:hypothetical protein